MLGRMGIKNENWCDYRNIIMKPQKTSFSNISKISAGYDHYSLFQNNKEQYFYVLILITDNVDWGNYNEFQIMNKDDKVDNDKVIL